MGNGDFIGHCGSPGDGKERSDGQVQGAAEKDTVKRAHPPCQLLQILPGKADGQHRSKGQSHAGDQKSRRGVPGIPAGILSHKSRKYQISRAKKEGKQHEPDSDEFIGCFFHRVPISHFFI